MKHTTNEYLIDSADLADLEQRICDVFNYERGNAYRIGLSDGKRQAKEAPAFQAISLIAKELLDWWIAKRLQSRDTRRNQPELNSESVSPKTTI